jgi:hypothetical protein
MFTNENVSQALFSERQEAFKYVILFTSGLVALVGVLVFVFLQPNPSEAEENQRNTPAWDTIKKVIKIPSVGLLMVIVLCAYVGYKLTDVISLYAKEIMFFDEVEAAQVGTFQLYLRPLVCISIGLLANKRRAALWMIIGFLVMLVGALLFASGSIGPSMPGFFILSVVVTASGTYAVRTLYFAAMQEGKIPLVVTGTAVGLISVVGYTPDIFVGPIIGYLLDGYPGELGHQYVFAMLAVFSLIGLTATVAFKRVSEN